MRPRRRRLEALPHELEEAVQAAPDVLAVPVPGRLQTRHLQVPQPLEAVPSAVGLRVHRHVAQLRPRLAAEQEQQPVQVAQALRPQPLRQVAAPGLRPRRLAPQRAQRLVAQQLDGLAQRVPELARDPERVPVAALVERVQQGRPRPRQRRLAVQQGRRGPQRGPLATVQDAPPVEAQQAPLGPLAALQQQRLVDRQQQRPARRALGAEHPPRENRVPGLAQDVRRGRRLPGELRRVGPQLERIVAVGVGRVRAQRQQASAHPLRLAQHRNLLPGLERERGWRPAVAQRLQLQAEPAPLDPHRLPVVARPPERLPDASVLPGQGPQPDVRRVRPLLARRGRGAPPRHHRPQVAPQQLRQVVVAVELPLVVQPDVPGRSVQTLWHGPPPHSPLFQSRPRADRSARLTILAVCRLRTDEVEWKYKNSN